MKAIDCTSQHSLGIKCEYCDYAEPMAMPPMMGAMSWADVDAQEAVMEQTEEVQKLTSQYNNMVNCIVMCDASPGDKATMLQDAANGYAERVGALQSQGGRSFVDRLLGRKATSADGLGAADYAVVPDAKTPSGWKLRIDDASHISGAIQALSPAGYRGQKAQLDPGQRAEAIRRISGAIKRLPEADRGNLPDRLAALKAVDNDGQITFTRGKAGGPDRFAMWASNNFRDRAGETFPATAIEAAVDRFNARDGAKGHANVWHVGHPEYGWRGYPRELSDWGEIEHAAFADGFLLVEGRVLDPSVAAGIKAWGEREPLGTSIEYAYWDTDLRNGVYDTFDFDRVSVLPRQVAANQWGPETALTLGKGETDMPFSNEAQRTALATLWGEETVKGWEDQAQERAADLKARGVAAKELQVQPPPVTLTFIESTKEDEASTADTTPAATVADGGASAGAAAEAEVPSWAKALADQNAAILARLDQSEAAVKAVSDELANAAPAVGVLGRSVQNAGLIDVAGKELSAQDAAIQQYRNTGTAPSPEMVGVVADGGILGKIAASFGNMGNGQRPAGA